MEERMEQGIKWFRCDHLTNGMRKSFLFRMIGNLLYCRPNKDKYQRYTYADVLAFRKEVDDREAVFCRKMGFHPSVTRLA